MIMDKESKKLLVKIVTPAGTTYTGSAQMVVAPASQGTVGILPHHISFFSKLNPGEVKIKEDNKEEFFAVTGGFIDVNADGQVSILTDSAQRSEAIDEKAAAAAKEKAEKLLSERQKLSEKEFAIAEASLRKALLELKVAKKRREKIFPSG